MIYEIKYKYTNYIINDGVKKMAYESCPISGGYGAAGFYLNWILVAIIFALIFWGVYYLLIKKEKIQGGKKK